MSKKPEKIDSSKAWYGTTDSQGVAKPSPCYPVEYYVPLLQQNGDNYACPALNIYQSIDLMKADWLPTDDKKKPLGPGKFIGFEIRNGFGMTHDSVKEYETRCREGETQRALTEASEAELKQALEKNQSRKNKQTKE